MPIAEQIREFLRDHPTEKLFTRGDLLVFGHRIAVDSAIYHLVHKTGEIVRVARGLFAKRERQSPVTVLEAVTVKSRRFGKEVITAPECVAYDIGISSAAVEELVFVTTGRTSSFLFQGKRITTRGTSPRKMALGDSLPGRIIRALCHLGKDAVTEKVVGQATRSLGTEERAVIGRLSAMMPGWLNDFFFAWSGFASSKAGATQTESDSRSKSSNKKFGGSKTHKLRT